VTTREGTEVLADGVASYFNRTEERFCSHKHSPSSGKTVYPAITRKGRAIYFAHPIFTQYSENAPLWCRKLFSNALALLLPDPTVRVEGPSSLIVTVNEQAGEDRWVLHLLHYIPERRGRAFDVIEDVIPVYDIKVSVRVPRAVKSVALVPEKKTLGFEHKNDRAEFVVTVVAGHQMVELAFG